MHHLFKWCILLWWFYNRNNRIFLKWYNVLNINLMDGSNLKIHWIYITRNIFIDSMWKVFTVEKKTPKLLEKRENWRIFYIAFCGKPKKNRKEISFASSTFWMTLYMDGNVSNKKSKCKTTSRIFVIFLNWEYWGWIYHTICDNV